MTYIGHKGVVVGFGLHDVICAIKDLAGDLSKGVIEVPNVGREEAVEDAVLDN